MTLMEVIIAIVLVGIAFGGIATTVTWSINTIRASRESAAALQFAQQKMERMRNSNFGTISSHAFPSPYEASAFRTALGPNAAGSVVVQDEASKLKKVTAHVGWVSSSGRNMHLSLVTYIAEDGIDQR